MNLDYSPVAVVQGRANQDKAKENPNTFAMDSGAENVTQATQLDRPKQRMAGQMGHRIMEYLQDPAEQARTESWMEMFELSNEGQLFNQAKMGGAPQV
jgi:hypothetical protein